jgi:hypothetical protein
MAETFFYTNGKASRVWTLDRDGDVLVTATGKTLDSLKESRKSLGTEDKAIKQAEKERQKKTKAHFVFTNDRASRGEVAVRAWLPPGDNRYFDVHPNGRDIFSAAASGATVTLRRLELPLGERSDLHFDNGAPTLPAGVTSSGATHPTVFSHATVCLGRHYVLYTVDGRTWKVPFDTAGEPEVVASFHEGFDQFNAHSVAPTRDGMYTRALVFDADMTLRVIDDAGRTVFETTVSSNVVECRAAAISHSGKHVVAYFVSRHLTHPEGSHAIPADAPRDETREVRVWEVASAKLAHRIAVDHDVSVIGLTPDDRHLVVMKGIEGPAFYDLESGQQAFHFPHFMANRPDLWLPSTTFAFSPDGRMLALATRPRRVVDPDDKSTLMEVQRDNLMAPRHIVFGPDGCTLYDGCAKGDLFGFRVTQAGN